MPKSKYDDIINLKYRKSQKRKPMERYMRAAQFAPFAALTGYDLAIKETARETHKKITPDENRMDEINYRLFCLLENVKNEILAEITYFVPDKTKDGGENTTITDIIVKYDDFTKCIITKGNVEIPVENLLWVESEIFNIDII